MNDADDVGKSQADEATADPGFRHLLDKLSADHAFDFREYKPTSLARRIRSRMQQVHVDTFDDYVTYIDRHPGEHVALFNSILINVTSFFRDPEAWQVLGEEIIPRLVDEAADSRSLRLWSVGCSSGQEAFSTAILLAEHLGNRAGDFNVKIYATDVDEEALSTARHALYRVDDLKDVPTSLLEKYFSREGQAYRFRRDLRRWCIFGRHNVAQDPPLSHIDLLICRNALIYFTRDLQDRILARFHYAVIERGFLFLGRSESLLARSRWFAPHNVKWRIFQRTTTPAATVATAMLGGGGDAGNLAVAGSRPTDLSPVVVRLQRVLEMLPTAIMVLDVMDTVLVWNTAAESLFDISGDHAIGRKFRDLDISYRVEGLRARVEEVKSAHIPSRIEHAMFTRRSGETVHAELTIVPMVEGNRVTVVAVYGTDATESARLRDQTTRLAEQHSTAIEELQSTNEELETTNEELQSTNEELETTNEELQSTNEELETTVEELQAANAELGSLNTQLERRGVELKNLDEYQQSVLSSLQHAIVVLDRHGLVTTWNQTAERLWGLPVEHVVRRLFWTLPVGDIAPKLREALTRMLDSGSREAETLHDVPFRLPTGETRHLTVQVTPLESTSGEVTGVVGIASPMDSGVTAPAPGGKPR
ncbi:MAG: chemotaxis protein CheR [Candidatus Rokuibacteriota bacterium]|nr:MAG: chemotaxis protein CheR [Candidatus Rokubacteria bacterium]